MLKEKLHDCQIVDSAYAAKEYDNKKVLILKNGELSIVNDRLGKAEYKLEKAQKKEKFWRKIAVPSLGLNAILVLLLL